MSDKEEAKPMSTEIEQPNKPISRREFLGKAAAVAGTVAVAGTLLEQGSKALAADSESGEPNSVYSGPIEGMRGEVLLNPARLENGLTYLRRFDDPFLTNLSNNILEATQADHRMGYFPGWVNPSPLRVTESNTHSLVYLQPEWKQDPNSGYLFRAGQITEEKPEIQNIGLGMSLRTTNSADAAIDGTALAKEWIMLAAGVSIAEGVHDQVLRTPGNAFLDKQGNPITDRFRQIIVGVSRFAELANNPEADVPYMLDDLADYILASRLMIGPAHQFPTHDRNLVEAGQILQRNDDLRHEIFEICRTWVYGRTEGARGGDPTSTLPEAGLFGRVCREPLQSGLATLRSRKNSPQNPAPSRTLDG